MDIRQFNKLAPQDGGTYVTQLVKGAVEGLEAHSNKQDADKVYNFFNSGNGIKQFYKNLEILDAADEKNIANPNNKQPPYKVEQAFALTLKQNGVIVPLSFLLTINKDFKPQHSPAKP